MNLGLGQSQLRQATRNEGFCVPEQTSRDGCKKCWFVAGLCRREVVDTSVKEQAAPVRVALRFESRSYR